jgi:polyhydroxyalkanoate synthesis repressor PhaR
MQTIKKYSNRKLYHTNRKQYITLDGIAALIQAGDPVQVLDNETGDDITAQILTQVVLQTRSGGDRLPTQVLTGLIQAGGDTIAGVRRSFWSAIGGTSVVDAELRRRLDQLHADGRIDAAELARLHDLLLHQPDSSHAEGSEMPSHRDIVHLREQVESLTAMVDQLLAERGQRPAD